MLTVQCLRIIFLFVKGCRRKDGNKWKTFLHAHNRRRKNASRLDSYVDEKTLVAAAVLAGRAEVVQSSSSSVQHQQTPAGRSAVYPVVLDTRCASNAATTTKSPSLLFVGVRSAREGAVAANIRSVVATVHALACSRSCSQ